MSDPHLTELWQKAPPPWNTLGPEMAARIKSGILITNRSGFPTNAPQSQLTRWARQLREARLSRAIRRSEAARAIGVDPHAIYEIEMDRAGPKNATWAKLAAFYGVTLE